MQDQSELTPELEHELDRRVEALKRFRPSSKIISPSQGKQGEPLDDALAVIAGTKPAAILDGEIDTGCICKSNVPVKALLAYAAKNGQHTTSRTVEAPSISFYVARTKTDLSELVELHKNGLFVILASREIDPSKAHKTPALAYYHRRMGELLGYPKESIQTFLSGVQLDTDASQESFYRAAQASKEFLDRPKVESPLLRKAALKQALGIGSAFIC